MKLRKARQMTRRVLAKKADVAPSYIREVERGRKTVSAAAVVKLAHGLGISELVALSLFRIASRSERPDVAGVLSMAAVPSPERVPNFVTVRR